MSTRAAIARPNGDGFLGRYHHWDGYPDGLGQTLFWLSQPNWVRVERGLPPTPWDGDTEAMLKVLIDEHPAGWSTINDKDMRRASGFHESFGKGVPCIECGKQMEEHLCQHIKDHGPVKPCKAGEPATLYNEHLGHAYEPDPIKAADVALTPECYCHGDRHEDEWLVDEKNASGSGVEYVYVITGRKMTVLSSVTEIDGVPAKMVGWFGSGDENAEWKPIGYVELDHQFEPNWTAMYESQYEEDDVPIDAI